MTMTADHAAGLLLPPVLSAQLQAAAEQQRRNAHDVLRDAVEQYLRLDQAAMPGTVNRWSPAEAAARMLRERAENPRLTNVQLRQLITTGRA